MSDEALRVELLKAQEDARYWRERCKRYENHFIRLEQAGASVRGAVEQFLIVLNHVKPPGTEPRA